MVTVSAYVRVSTDKQTLDNQRSEISRFALSRGLEIDTWVEEVISGKARGKKRKLEAYLKKMKKGDILIVSELSRLSRTLLDIMSIMRTILDKEVVLYSVKENCCLGDNINSKVILFAFGLVAEIERDLISMRTKEALALRKEQGTKLGRKPGECPKIKMLKSQEEGILRDYASCRNISSLSKAYGVSRETMSKFLKGYAANTTVR